MERCTHCKARLLPGDVECRSCGFDLISGRMPGEKSSLERKRTARLAAAAGASLVLVFAGAFTLGSLNHAPEEAESPCVETLRAIQPVVKAHSGELPRCGRTPPGPTDCWSLAGVGTALLPRREDLWLMLRPTDDGFEITCRADEDGDGQWALFQANADIQALRISRDEVR